MLEFIKLGGFMMWPLLLCSVLTVAIVVERLLALRPAKLAPGGTSSQIWEWVHAGQLDSKRLREIRESSPLGSILAAGLLNARHGREIMKEAIMDKAGHEVHDMQRFLTLLGSIAAMSPLMGLLGTVLGMVDMFNSLIVSGSGNNALLAAGIGKALYTTVAGLVVAIPALFFHRFFNRRIDEVVVLMEQEAILLVDLLVNEQEKAVA